MAAYKAPAHAGNNENIDKVVDAVDAVPDEDRDDEMKKPWLEMPVSCCFFFCPNQHTTATCCRQ
jgi:hypothetical protein